MLFRCRIEKPLLDKANRVTTQLGTFTAEMFRIFVAQIARTPRDGNDKPRIPVVLKSVTIERVGPVPDNAPESPRRPTPPAAAPKKK